LEMAARKARAVGARTAGTSPGRSLREPNRRACGWWQRRKRAFEPSFCSKFCYQGRRPAGGLWPYINFSAFM
jgi:hypothetical protein